MRMKRSASATPPADEQGIASRLLIAIRERRGLSQAELARRAGMPRSVINAYEHGARDPGVQTLARIAVAAGMQLEARPRDPVDPERAGRLLAQVLDLAEALPHRRRGELAYPALKRLVALGAS